MYSILCLGPVTLYEKGTLKHFTKRYSIFNISSMTSSTRAFAQNYYQEVKDLNNDGLNSYFGSMNRVLQF